MVKISFRLFTGRLLKLAVITANTTSKLETVNKFDSMALETW